MSDIATTCPYCGVGCGLRATPEGALRPDPDHPANRGRLCVKGAALADTLDDTGRLATPLHRGEAIGWDEAMDRLAGAFAGALAEHGPDAVALYLSGQCLTEDYYVANKLMKGFLGSANIDTNSRLCMAASVAGHLRAFGEDVVPGCYADWEEADLAVLVGSHAAWCHPVLFQRLQAARAARGTRLVVIDPRRTETADAADLHLGLRPGSDVALFNGLLVHLADAGAIERAWAARHTAGLEQALAAARAEAPDAAAVARLTGLDPAAVARFYSWFAATPRTLTAYSQGVNQSASGTDKVNAILNVHLATARIGRPGCGPFSLTGQPNAMGGREVGGLAGQLAAHLSLENPAHRDRVRRFWRAPAVAARPGLKATEIFAAAAAGKLKALWIMATNPAASLPETDLVRAALARCPFVAVSDCWPTETTARATLVLPAAGWGEKEGTVTNSERMISRQRAFRRPPGEARADWRTLADLAARLGFGEAFAWRDPAAIFREHAALSAFENDGARRFDIGALAALSDQEYAALPPTRWPAPASGPGSERLFAEGGFPTADGRARLVAVRTRLPAAGPFLLNTGRVRDQWHTMTRTGRAPRLMAHADAPRLALAPEDAARLGLAAEDLVRITTATGSAVVPAVPDPAQAAGECFLPMHWTDAFASSGPVGRLITTRLDPHSGQPELKAEPAALERVATRWRALILAVDPAPPPCAHFWARVPLEHGHGFTLAGWDDPPDPAALLRARAGDGRIEVSDPARGLHRLALLRGGRLVACLFLATGPAALPERAALAARFPAADPLALLAGRTLAAPPAGAVVCSCFAVGLATLRAAIAEQGLASVGAIGAALRAGTNCGSCIPELERILRDAPACAA